MDDVKKKNSAERNVPNKETAKAIAEGRRLAKNKETKGYTSIAKLKAALES